MLTKSELKDRFNIKISIVGCGNIAKVHLRYITQYVNKGNIALCDKDKLRLDNFAQKNGIEKVYSDLDIMLSEFQPQVVHILTPPATHKDIAIKCLESGCHILIEKPMCLSIEEADEIIKMAHYKNRLVCVDHMRLFDPQVVKIKKILNTGKLGKIVNISAGYSYDFLKRINTDAASRWINNLPGGTFFDIMPHPLCLLEEFLPSLRVEKSVYWKNQDNVITDLWCIFSSPSGTGTLHMSLNIFPLKNYIVFECTKGILTIDFRNFLIVIRKQYNLPNAVERIVGNLSVGIQIFKGTVSSVFNFIRGKLDPYAGLDYIIQQFYIAIINGGKSPVPAEKAKLLLALTGEIFSKEATEQKKEIIDTQNEMAREADILVTGATGFIGRRLVNGLLKKGKKVRILTHQKLKDEEIKSLFSNSVEIINGDIYNYKDVERACEGIDTVYHLAAATRGDWNYHLDTTITGTKNVLEAAVKKGIRRFVYVSTLNVYNAKQYPQNGLINEDFPYEDTPEKRGAYSHAKLKAEKIVREYADKKEMSISIIRPGLVYGPGREAFLKDAGMRLGRRLVVTLGGKRRLPLVYVDNLVDALLLAGNSRGKAKSIFNIVDNDYPTQCEFIKTYKKLSGERFFTIYIPMWIVFSGFWMIERLLSVVIKKSPSLCYKLRCVNKSVKYSTERIEKTLGWSQRVNFEQGLKLTIQEQAEE